MVWKNHLDEGENVMTSWGVLTSHQNLWSPSEKILQWCHQLFSWPRRGRSLRVTCWSTSRRKYQVKTFYFILNFLVWKNHLDEGKNVMTFVRCFHPPTKICNHPPPKNFANRVINFSADLERKVIACHILVDIQAKIPGQKLFILHWNFLVWKNHLDEGKNVMTSWGVLTSHQNLWSPSPKILQCCHQLFCWPRRGRSLRVTS